MPIIRLAAALFALAVLATVLPVEGVWAQGADDRLGVPGPLSFDGTEYSLAWSAAPSPDYTKQEYLPAGQAPERFESMVLVEFLKGDVAPADLALAQTDMLKARRATDPLVNYDILINEARGEVILDFLMSGESAGGERIAEWNGYRYLKGEDGGWLLGISRRAYGDGITAFLKDLRDRRSEDIDTLAAMEAPFR